MQYIYVSLHRSVCPLVVQLYTVKDEAVNPLCPRKYTVLSGNFVFIVYDFDLHDSFQECNPGIKRDLPFVILRDRSLFH